MANSVIGQILSIGPTQSLTSKGGSSFTKRNIVISVRRFDPNTGEPVNDYENTPELSFMGDKCAVLDQFQVGQHVEVFFDLRGSKYTDQSGVEKIITDVRPYKILPYGQSRQAQQVVQPAPQTYPAYVPQQTYNPGAVNAQPQRSLADSFPPAPNAGQNEMMF